MVSSATQYNYLFGAFYMKSIYSRSASMVYQKHPEYTRW